MKFYDKILFLDDSLTTTKAIRQTSFDGMESSKYLSGVLYAMYAIQTLKSQSHNFMVITFK